MAFEPQRFIHAANLRLDVPVSVQTTEAITDELRFAFEDATLHAFEEVIDASIRHDVDFLLLSGNVFIEADRSLRARLALLKGVRRLAEHDIQVFVLPGDSDPPEAWRGIPEMPDNVVVCYSSNPEPEELYVKDRLATTISSSIWFGEADAFGIQVIAKVTDGIQPFRIGVVSKSKYEESRRMAAMAASASDETLSASVSNLTSGEQLTESDSGESEDQSTRVWRSIDVEQGELPRKLDSGRRSIKRSVETLESGPADAHPSLDPGFMRYVDEMLHEGKLNFLALTGELGRTTLWRDEGVVHCPGTTQPRSQMEASGGACSLVEVSASGEVRISSVDSSSVDWKQIEVKVASHTNLSSILQQMKTLLLAQKPGAADRIWSVQWILRGALPVLQELARNDLDIAAAVELDELKHTGRTIRLLHDIRSLPNAWPTGDPPTGLADQFQQIVARPRVLTDDALQTLIDTNQELSAGWRQRMTALLPSIDPEQILARLRTDGATWFAPDFGVTGEHEDEESGIDETDSEIADGQEVERAELSDDGDDSAEVDAEYHDDESGDESDD
ncbi:MAG: hypothetical protein KDB01_24520 [Planctomycetaceae bacterium]|nr:hypothetical protein [Planctomycetaceae bacterium]